MTGTDDVKIIEGVIRCYLDGLYESDAGKIAGVFHPTSALTSVTDDGELVITPAMPGWTRFEPGRRRNSRACPATIRC